MTFVMEEFVQSLMSTSPHGPRQAVQRSQWSDPDEIPEKPTHLWETQRHHHGQRRPRLRLNWESELVGLLGAALGSLISGFFPNSPWL